MAQKAKKTEPKNKIGEVEVGTILYANTGVPLKVLEYSKTFGGRVKVERADEHGEGIAPKWMPLSKLSATKKHEGGGGVGKFFSKVKQSAKEGFDKTKKATKDAIHNQKKKVALEVMEDTKGKVSVNKNAKEAMQYAENLVSNRQMNFFETLSNYMGKYNVVTSFRGKNNIMIHSPYLMV